MRSIFAADMFRKSDSSHLSRPADDAEVLFPTGTTHVLFDMVHGRIGGCRGRTVHQALRDPDVLRKQLFYGMCRRVFDGATLDRVLGEWRAHRRTFPPRAISAARGDDGGGGGGDDARYVEVWAASLGQSVRCATAALVREILDGRALDEAYGLYVDWISTLGIVPIHDRRDTNAERRQRLDLIYSLVTRHASSSPLAADLLSAGAEYLARVLDGLGAAEIAQPSDVTVERERRSGKLRCRGRGGARQRLYVHAAPLMRAGQAGAGGTGDAGGPLYTSVAAHLYKEILRYESLREHQKICQLLNTFPVKMITASRHELNSKKIVDLMEKHDKATDAKKSIIKFLLNVSESKSRIGLEDSVESFIQDLSPSIIDQSKLLHPRAFSPGDASEPHPPPERSIRDLFKKQVIKCLEEQIQDQAAEIQELKLLSDSWEKKVSELQSLLSRHGLGEERGAAAAGSQDLYGVPPLEAARAVAQGPGYAHPLSDNRVLANSFFSQYVPNTDRAEDRLDDLWECEYMRTFKLRKDVTFQGTESRVSYSNYTVERVLSPFVSDVLGIPQLEHIPEDCLLLSSGELVDAAYRESRLARYVDFVCRRDAEESPEAVGSQRVAGTQNPRGGERGGTAAKDDGVGRKRRSVSRGSSSSPSSSPRKTRRRR